MKKRTKIAIKSMLKFLIAAGVALVVGIIMFSVGAPKESFALEIVGIILLFLAAAFVFGGYMTTKENVNAICPECQEFMGKTDKEVEYSYTCDQYKENYDDRNKFKDYTFYYTCTIVCPHCGSSSVFEYKTNAKNASQANVNVNNHIKSLLKLKKSTLA